LDIAGIWRDLRAGPADIPRPGSQAAPGEGITITVAQQCQFALPPAQFVADVVTVTVTSGRPGMAAEVKIYANLNSVDGSYQGPTSLVGQGQFTATGTQVQAGFVVLPSTWPVLGVGAQAVWQDGSPDSLALSYVGIVCRWAWWWRWLFWVFDALTLRPLRARTGSILRDRAIRRQTHP